MTDRNEMEVLSGATDLYKTYESCMLRIAQERISELQTENEKLYELLTSFVACMRDDTILMGDYVGLCEKAKEALGLFSIAEDNGLLVMGRKIAKEALENEEVK